MQLQENNQFKTGGMKWTYCNHPEPHANVILSACFHIYLPLRCFIKHLSSQIWNTITSHLVGLPLHTIISTKHLHCLLSLQGSPTSPHCCIPSTVRFKTLILAYKVKQTPACLKTLMFHFKPRARLSIPQDMHHDASL